MVQYKLDIATQANRSNLMFLQVIDLKELLPIKFLQILSTNQSMSTFWILTKIEWATFKQSESIIKDLGSTPIEKFFWNPNTGPLRGDQGLSSDLS